MPGLSASELHQLADMVDAANRFDDSLDMTAVITVDGEDCGFVEYRLRDDQPEGRLPGYEFFPSGDSYWFDDDGDGEPVPVPDTPTAADGDRHLRLVS
jgi:hypothetical protein